MAGTWRAGSEGWWVFLKPPSSGQAGYKAGTWRAGSEGWWVFLKPPSSGQHTMFYNIRVTPTGALTSPGTNPHFADITYNLQVVK
jgi:hypothetical protein